MTKEYEKLKARSKHWGESNDCSVIALALATNSTYEEAHGWLALRGRNKRKGTDMNSFWCAMPKKFTTKVIYSKSQISQYHSWKNYFQSKKDFENYWSKHGKFTKKEIKKMAQYDKKTIATILETLPSRGVFVVETSDHVLCIRGGQIHDWSQGRKHRVIKITRITKGGQKSE